MQCNKRRTRSSQANLVAEPFLRSINIAFDANQPERISHFRPTSKCARGATKLGLCDSLQQANDSLEKLKSLEIKSAHNPAVTETFAERHD